MSSRDTKTWTTYQCEGDDEQENKEDLYVSETLDCLNDGRRWPIQRDRVKTFSEQDRMQVKLTKQQQGWLSKQREKQLKQRKAGRFKIECIIYLGTVMMWR